MRGWRPLLRFAWRDVLRSRGRTALVLVMIALPVLAVTVAATVLATERIDGGEALERQLGAADARIVVDRHTARVWHGADPDAASSSEGASRGFEPMTPEDVATVLDREVRLLELRSGETRVETEGGATVAAVNELDLRDPLAEGLVTLEEGRLPEAPGQAFVNRALAEKGPGLGEVLRLTDGTGLVVVGVGEDATSRSFPVAYTIPEDPGAASLSAQASTTWLVDAGGPVTWGDVRALNGRGAYVLSRAVMQDPPAEHELPAEMQGMSGGGSIGAAIAVLVVTMVLLEVVLLAGPAFAVTVRRQSRNLALMAATGGTPGQARLAILAIALVLGGLAALLGVGLGLLLARGVALPLTQRFATSWFGPFDVPWAALVAVAVCGVVAAVLAAVVPAWLASRMDVVAVLAGRRGEGKPSRRSPLVGLVLLGGGVAGAAYGARMPSDGEFFIAVAAVVSVLGMILLVPVVVTVVARLGRFLPLPVRYAVRDAARHRTRTVPAIAAVAATVTGVVALGISTSSDAKENEATYSPQLTHGTALVTASGTGGQWAQLRGIVRKEVPDATVTEVVGVAAGVDQWVNMTYQAPGVRAATWRLEWAGGSLGTMDLVADEVPDALTGLSAEARAQADAALAQDRVVVLTSAPVDRDEVRMRGNRFDELTDERRAVLAPVTVPAAYVVVEDRGAAVQAIIPPAVADQLALESGTTGLLVSGAELSEAVTDRLEEAVTGAGSGAWFYVERGYQGDETDLIVKLVLGSLGGILMLGGTLTATFLALNDARPDLATLAAVGAAPRLRRAVAASYALVVGGIGAVLGAVVGFIPGIAVAFPLTTTGNDTWSSPPGEGTFSVNGDGMPDQIGPFLEIPWLMIAIVVVCLPLLTAAVVGAFSRSRLPMVARVE